MMLRLFRDAYATPLRHMMPQPPMPMPLLSPLIDCHYFEMICRRMPFSLLLMVSHVVFAEQRYEGISARQHAAMLICYGRRARYMRHGICYYDSQAPCHDAICQRERAWICYICYSVKMLTDMLQATCCQLMLLMLMPYGVLLLCQSAIYEDMAMMRALC